MVYAVFALSSILSQELSTVFVDKIMLKILWAIYFKNSFSILALWLQRGKILRLPWNNHG